MGVREMRAPQDESESSPISRNRSHCGVRQDTSDRDHRWSLNDARELLRDGGADPARASALWRGVSANCAETCVYRRPAEFAANNEPVGAPLDGAGAPNVHANGQLGPSEPA
jgi:hypothetical protein